MEPVQIDKCPRNHQIIFSFEPIEFLNFEFYKCYRCNSKGLIKRGRYLCKICNINICWSCCLPHSNIIKNCQLCPNGHELIIESYSGCLSCLGFHCNICKEKYASNNLRWLCVKCKYNICFNCKNGHPNNISLSSQNIQSNSSYRKTCFNGHKVVFDKVTSSRRVTKYICDLCRISSNISKGRWNCRKCDFDLCWNCRSPCELVELKCNNNHSLTFTSSSEGYITSEYNCAICGNENLSFEIGRYSCLNCKYDVCWKCEQPEPEYVKSLSKCFRNHNLRFNKEISIQNLNGFRCELCNSKSNPTEGRWNCDICHFNLCNKCKGPNDIFLGLELQLNEKLEIPNNEKELCKICFTYKINTVLVPCGHLCLCSFCSSKIEKNICPVCNKPIQNIIKTYSC